ncbi:VOC family protein [Pseudomonas sp. NBRC 111127]|uniref:VOC family protein n=1 Tax=Pseudomonas sp. NBRC 111127 TaxID=1661042 RepID=UPI00210AEB38|nr:VOC family protein [Pseudomonas sp. NBRC 111127]
MIIMDTGIFNYICLGVRDLDKATKFYDAVLATLGLRRCITEDSESWDGWAGWGFYTPDGYEHALWICRPYNRKPATAGNGTMIALKAPTWEAVREFHSTALEFGGFCEGGAGLRPYYQHDFYAAYIRDVDGNKIAAVCRGQCAEVEHK